MKRLVVLAGCAVILLGLAGCQNTGGGDRGVGPAPTRGDVEVIIEGGGEFPEFLVGTWKDEKRGWEFVFEPDGTISSVVMGPIPIEMKGGTLAGNITDVLLGPVSGEQWQAEWFNFPKYTSFIPEPHELRVDPNNNPIEILVFKKQLVTN